MCIQEDLITFSYLLPDSECVTLRVERPGVQSIVVPDTKNPASRTEVLPPEGKHQVFLSVYEPTLVVPLSVGGYLRVLSESGPAVGVALPDSWGLSDHRVPETGSWVSGGSFPSSLPVPPLHPGLKEVYLSSW